MSNETILVVDDNPMNVKLARVLLSGEGYDVRTAADSEEAMRVLERFHPRLILMDIQLPGMDGLALTRLLKTDPKTEGAIVVALTAYAMKGDEQKARSAGCDGYIAKPIDTRTFPGLIRRYLDRTEPMQTPAAKGDIHNLLADLRNNFLVEGEEESRRLLSNVDLDSVARLAHRWKGVAGTLGLAQITNKAREIEWALEAEPEGGPELTIRIREIKALFSAAVRGGEPMPPPHPDVVRGLEGKRLALSGFDDAESGRMAKAFEQARAFTKDLGTLSKRLSQEALQPYDLLIMNACTEEGYSSWMATSGRKDLDKPLLIVGSRSLMLDPNAVLDRNLQLPDKSYDFLLAPWDPEEAVLRAYRMLAKPSSNGAGAVKAEKAQEKSRKARVLIADDDPIVVALVGEVLEKFDIECHAAWDGQQALDLVRELKPDVVILDISMPRMNGFDVLVTVRHDDQLRKLPVLLLTACQKESDLMRGFGFGADDYVIKPFNPMELLARVSRLLPKAASA